MLHLFLFRKVFSVNCSVVNVELCQFSVPVPLCRCCLVFLPTCRRCSVLRAFVHLMLSGRCPLRSVDFFQSSVLMSKVFDVAC